MEAMFLFAAATAWLSACSGSSGGSSPVVRVPDTVPPTAGQVFEGLSGDLDVQDSTTTLSAHWTGFTDAGSGVASYEWALGGSPGAPGAWLLCGDVGDV